MYEHILIAIDGSPSADRALTHGLSLAKRLNAKVTALTVTLPWSALDMAHETRLGSRNPIGAYEETAAASAAAILEAALQKAKDVAVPCEIVHMADRHPAEEIVKFAKDASCDLIIMASHGRRGLGRLLLGSQTSEVLSHTEIPTLVIR